MAERGFVIRDVIDILREGTVTDEPEKGDNGEWRYKVRMPRFRGSRSAGVITVVLEEGKLFIVTVMWLDTK